MFVAVCSPSNRGAVARSNINLRADAKRFFTPLKSCYGVWKGIVRFN